MLHNVWHMAYSVTVWQLLSVCLNCEQVILLQCESFLDKEKGLTVTVMNEQFKETSKKYINCFLQLDN